jgi:hypothetical protein
LRESTAAAIIKAASLLGEAAFDKGYGKHSKERIKHFITHLSIDGEGQNNGHQ